MIRTGSSKSTSQLARTKNRSVARASGAWVLRWRWQWRYSPMPLPRRGPFGCRRALGSRRSRGRSGSGRVRSGRGGVLWMVVRVCGVTERARSLRYLLGVDRPWSSCPLRGRLPTGSAERAPPRRRRRRRRVDRAAAISATPPCREGRRSRSARPQRRDGTGAGRRQTTGRLPMNSIPAARPREASPLQSRPTGRGTRTPRTGPAER